MEVASRSVIATYPGTATEASNCRERPWVALWESWDRLLPSRQGEPSCPGREGRRMRRRKRRKKRRRTRKKHRPLRSSEHYGDGE